MPTRTVDFNYNYPYFPVNSLDGCRPIHLYWESQSRSIGLLATTNYLSGRVRTHGRHLSQWRTDAGRRARRFNTDSGSTLQLSNAGNVTGFQLNHPERGIEGRRAARWWSTPRTSAIPPAPIFSPCLFPWPVERSLWVLVSNLPGLNFGLSSYFDARPLPTASRPASVQFLERTGVILPGMTTAGDQTSLTVTASRAANDTFGGSIGGIGQFIAGGQGTLTVRCVEPGEHQFDRSGQRHARRQRLDRAPAACW